MNEGKELVEYTSELPVNIPKNNIFDDLDTKRIVKQVKRQQIIATVCAYWRFASLATAFAALFFLMYFVFFDVNRARDDSENSLAQDYIEQTSEDTGIRDIEVSSPSVITPPILIDEAGTDINVNDYFCIDEDVRTVFNTDSVKVLIIHSHASEKVSSSMSVFESGEVITGLLASAGIKSIHSQIAHDEEGRIGAYKRMKETVSDLKKEHPEIVLVIDIHSSDEKMPLQFDVGVSSEHVWKENLRLVSAIHSKMENKECVVRLLPQALGQDSGILSISVSIGCENADDAYARKQIADLALGIVGLFTQNTPE